MNTKSIQKYDKKSAIGKFNIFLLKGKYAILIRLFSKKTLFLGIACLILLAWGDPVLAQGLAQPVKAQNTAGLQDIIEKIAFMNTVMHILTLIVLYFIQYLLQSDFFSNPAMLSAMNTIWQLSRDLMNIIFALMIIGVALYTIVTAKKDLITDKIQSFVVAVVLVNLSWFFPRVIIDVANILTATVYSIPQMMPGFSCKQFDDKAPGGRSPCIVVQDILIMPDNKAQENQFCGGYGTTPGGATINNRTCICKKSIGCYVTVPFTEARNSFGVGHLMINGLTVNFTKILVLPDITRAIAGPGPQTPKQSAIRTFQFIMNVGIAFIIQIAVLFPMIALVFGLLARIIVIWVATAFMPFVFLGYVINGKTLGTNVFGNSEFDIWEQFLAAAFLPFYVAIPITIGFVMLTTVVKIPIPSNLSMTFNVPLISGIGSWWGLLWLGASIAVLWKGSFAALSKMKATEGITSSIKDYGDTLFRGAKSLPLLTPIPLPNGAQNIGQLVNKPKQIAQSITSSTINQPLVNIPGRNGAASNDPTQIRAAAAALKDNATNTTEIVTAINNLNQNNTANPFTPAMISRLQLENGASNRQILARLQAIIATDDNQLASINAQSATINTLLNNPSIQ